MSEHVLAARPWRVPRPDLPRCCEPSRPRPRFPTDIPRAVPVGSTGIPGWRRSPRRSPELTKGLDVDPGGGERRERGEEAERHADQEEEAPGKAEILLARCLPFGDIRGRRPSAAARFSGDRHGDPRTRIASDKGRGDSIRSNNRPAAHRGAPSCSMASSYSSVARRKPDWTRRRRT